MNFLELKLIRRIATGIVSFTSFLVLILGFWLWGSVMAPPERATSTNVELTNSSEGLRFKRLPSAIQPAILAPTEPTTAFNKAALTDDLASNSKIETMALGCLKDGDHISKSSRARQVRLKTGLCFGQKPVLEKSNIVNRANGFEATLFQLEQGGFSSDYINLVDGENQIVMQLKDAKGRTVSTELTISRQPKL